MGHPNTRDRLCRAAIQPFPGEYDFTFSADHAADGPKRGGLASAVGAKEYGHTAFLDRNVDSVHNLGLAVKGLHRTQLQDRRH
jgi:hypothetical protein